jgi:lysophospholipase L1-like esterase
MNTDPHAIKILCYGDSNTWGQKPDKSGRFAANVRWTGKLQDLLGEKYYSVEEGLGGRTTDLEYTKRSGRNGRAYLAPCLDSHNPLDVVVIMLGTNDLKIEFNRNAHDVAVAIEGLIQDVKDTAGDQQDITPKIIIVSPIRINDAAPRFSEFYTSSFSHESALTSQRLAAEIATVAEANGCTFLDASTVAEPGDDGLHLTEESHTALTSLIARAVQR